MKLGKNSEGDQKRTFSGVYGGGFDQNTLYPWKKFLYNIFKINRTEEN